MATLPLTPNRNQAGEILPAASSPTTLALRKRESMARPVVLAGTNGHGTVVGTSQLELATALATGARRLLFGENIQELSRMLPPGNDQDILQIAVESRLMHGTFMAEQLADAIHHRAHLTAEAKPVLHVVLFELISNAIEHGNLGLTHERQDKAHYADWFETYNLKVRYMLDSALGKIPLLLTCRRVANNLEISLEDRGLGFNVRQVVENIKKANSDTPTGRGMSLVFSLLDNQVDYSQNGRRVCFRLPTRPRDESTLLPSMEHIREQARILIVDDQELNLRIASAAFETAGFTHIFTCKDANQAIAEAARLKPDLMLLDIAMPDMDGYSICSTMKANPMLKDIPIMFLTGYDDSHHRTQGYKIGGVDFATKPIEPTELVARSETHLLNGVMMRTLQHQAARMAQDIERARIFQQELLPSPASLTRLASQHNLDMATSYRACDSLAGDYWSLFELNPTSVAFCLIDFTGHGVIAALNTVQLHALLHSETDLGDPVTICRNLNRYLFQLLGNDSFATFIYGVLDTRTGALTYAAGGAPPMMLRHKDGRLTPLDCSGLPLGFAPTLDIQPHSLTMAPGDTLIAVSDAITESPHAGGFRWGNKGFMEALDKCPSGLPASQLLSRVLDAFYATVQLPVPDDLTALMLTFGHQSAELKEKNAQRA